jgi:hypothetical protein
MPNLHEVTQNSAPLTNLAPKFFSAELNRQWPSRELKLAPQLQSQLAQMLHPKRKEMTYLLRSGNGFMSKLLMRRAWSASMLT